MTSDFDARQFAPATQRNRDPILAILSQVLPQGTVLEISSGTGEHAIHFAPRLAPRAWIPSDLNPTALASIAAWQQHQPAANLYPPLKLDVTHSVWPIEQPLPVGFEGLNLKRDPIRAIVNINMIHISPWSACLGLMAGARRILPSAGVLYLYGPYKQKGEHTAPSNAEFDRSLQLQNPAWGVRDLEAVIAVAEAEQLRLVQTYPMPANNLSVVFQSQ
jgi:SAM-dependent methyltransferase